MHFYIDEIENKANYDEKTIMDTFGGDLKILKNYDKNLK